VKRVPEYRYTSGFELRQFCGDYIKVFLNQGEFGGFGFQSAGRGVVGYTECGVLIVGECGIKLVVNGMSQTSTRHPPVLEKCDDAVPCANTPAPAMADSVSPAIIILPVFIIVLRLI
jgi:hypothetical protein